MNSYDEANPFADSNARQPAASNYSTQKNNDYNPYTNTTTSAQSTTPVQQPSTAAFLPSPQPPINQPPAYTPVPVQQPPATRVDLSDYEKRQAELEAREKALADRERALTTPDAEKGTNRANNFPPFPKWCPIKPCFYHDINLDIATEFRPWVRYLFFLWIFYSFTLLLNMIAALSSFLVDMTGYGTAFGLSLVYMVVCIPLSYLCWFRSIYRAFNGFFRFNAMMKENKIVGTMIIIVAVLWSIISAAAIIATIKVHRLYRKSGASLEKAQKELQEEFVNNSTVQGAARGAARGVATAGINAALNNDDNQGPIY